MLVDSQQTNTPDLLGNLGRFGNRRGIIKRGWSRRRRRWRVWGRRSRLNILKR
jgi:hypothetical protein